MFQEAPQVTMIQAEVGNLLLHLGGWGFPMFLQLGGTSEYFGSWL